MASSWNSLKNLKLNPYEGAIIISSVISNSYLAHTKCFSNSRFNLNFRLQDDKFSLSRRQYPFWLCLNLHKFPLSQAQRMSKTRKDEKIFIVSSKQKFPKAASHVIPLNPEARSMPEIFFALIKCHESWGNFAHFTLTRCDIKRIIVSLTIAWFCTSNIDPRLRV